MKNLKVMLVAATIATCNVAMAQDQPVPAKAIVNKTPDSSTKNNAQQNEKDDKESRNERANKQVARVDGMCTLSADQKKQVHKLYMDSYEPIHQAKKDAGSDAAKAEAAVTKIQKERQDNLLKILTPEQRKKYHEESKDAHHDSHKEEHHNGNKEEHSK